MKKSKPKNAKPIRKRRKAIPQNVETAVLTKCKRRCAFCYVFDDNVGADTQGQLAHIDRNASNNSEENLAYLCFKHHDLYDSIPSQSKRLTPAELRNAKAKLEDYISLSGKHGPVQGSIVLKPSLTPYQDSDVAKLLDLMKVISSVSAEVSITGITEGGTKLTVEMDSDDIANLLKAFHSGKFSELPVASVTATVIDRNRSIAYCRGAGTHPTLSLPEHFAIRSFREAECFQDFQLKNSYGSVRFAAKQNCYDSNLVMLTCGYVGISRIELIEPIIFDKRRIAIGNLIGPLDLLKQFTGQYGLSLSDHRGKRVSNLILDETFMNLSLFNSELAGHELIAKLLAQNGRKTLGSGTSAIFTSTPQKVYIAILFAIHAEEREYQVRTWKNSTWF